MVWTDTDEDEENLFDVNDLTILNKVNNINNNIAHFIYINISFQIKKQKSNNTHRNLKIPSTTHNKEEWNLELEQVLPSLRVTIKLGR